MIRKRGHCIVALLVVIMVEFGWWALHSTRLSSEATLGGHGDPQETSECRSNSFDVFVTQGRNIYVLIVLRSTLGIEYSKMSPNISKISIPVLKPDDYSEIPFTCQNAMGSRLLYLFIEEF